MRKTTPIAPVSKTEVIQFAEILFREQKNYKKLDEYIKGCQTRLPISVYAGFMLKNETKLRFNKKDGSPKLDKEGNPKLSKKEKVARKLWNNLLEDSNVDLIFPTATLAEGYKYVLVLHKVVATKERFLHFNPLKPLHLGGKGKKKEEWLDPKLTLGIDEKFLSKIIMPHWELDYRDLPIEIKLQVGLLFRDNSGKASTTELEATWMKEIITDIQKHVKRGEIKEFHPLKKTREKKVK